MLETQDTDINIAVTPTTGTKLVVLMYDGAIGALHKALAAIEAGDGVARCNAVNMAVDILAQLCLSLDMERGGQIAVNLDNLYRFMITRLQRVNLLNDPEPARNVLGLLYPLYNAWRTLDEQLTEQSVMERQAPRQTEAARAVG